MEEMSGGAREARMVHVHDDLRALYEENVRIVYSYARARLGPDEGEDVTAEVFLDAATEFERGRGERVTTPWLMAVVHNKVIDRWRRATTRRSKWRAIVARHAAGGTRPE